MRYIGNKTKLLDKLEQLLSRKGLAKKGLVFCDLFGCGFSSQTKEHSGLCDWG